VVDYHDPVCSIRFVYFPFLFDTLLPIFVAACNGVLNRPTSLALSDRTRKKMQFRQFLLRPINLTFPSLPSDSIWPKCVFSPPCHYTELANPHPLLALICRTRIHLMERNRQILRRWLITERGQRTNKNTLENKHTISNHKVDLSTYVHKLSSNVSRTCSHPGSQHLVGSICNLSSSYTNHEDVESFGSSGSY
jgi:hypothetical protein